MPRCSPFTKRQQAVLNVASNATEGCLYWHASAYGIHSWTTAQLPGTHGTLPVPTSLMMTGSRQEAFTDARQAEGSAGYLQDERDAQHVVAPAIVYVAGLGQEYLHCTTSADGYH
jgi:hypothetical protein